MNLDTDTHISELKRQLLSKTDELDAALLSITELTRKLKESAFQLQSAENALAASDAASVVRDTELKTAEDALIASDVSLSMKSTELITAIENLTIANDQLRHSRDLQNSFIRIAAHELKNPIQPLLSIAEYLDKLNNTEVGTDEIKISRSDIEMIVRNARRLERLSNDILDVSRIEAKKLRLNRETFDLNREIRDVVRDLHMNGSKIGDVQIAFKPSPTQDSILMINADKSRIYEVLANIIGNAIKFTDHGSIVIISAIGKDGAAIVRIKDTGLGISDELMPNLFAKFGIANASDARSGSGLGLFISKGIIDAHGGKLWAENNRDGGGATFTFTIPCN